VIEEDDSISFETPWEENCQSCEGEWETLLPPLVVPGAEAEIPELEFTPLGVIEEETESADVPEPMTWVMIGTGLTALSVWRRRQNSRPL
jgi:hypothetical protein